MAAKNVCDTVLEKVFHANNGARKEKVEALRKRAEETSVNQHIEDDPSVREWLRDQVPTRAGAARYARNLFPSVGWTRRYNVHWMLGDAIAGLTVGLVVVPQAMAYALLARLTPEYGLYTSFTGAALYWVFGTSKDIVIGTTAVGSLLVGGVISKVEAEKPGVYHPQEVAHALSFLAGAIILVLGLLRLGWVIEFIPYVPISAFVTSASITIMSTQIPVVLGISGINTREAPYRVLINTFKSLPKAKLDAAIGLTSIALLFIIRDACAKMEIRQPSKKRVWAMLNSLRLTFTILLYTFISWLVHRSLPEGHSRFRIVGKIEPGFKHASVPKMDPELFGLVAAELPAIVIILIVEHIAIAKSFGRIFGYTVIPSQEMVAQGVANILSPFVGGYVCTGSFGASAVLSKAGVRTPLAGLFSAMILILALYALTSVFYYIPMAALAGLIIHATCNLITPPQSLYKYWKLSPLELLIWVVGVILALFSSLETSIYTTIVLSFVLLLVRLARTPGSSQGRVRVSRTGPSPFGGEDIAARSCSPSSENKRDDDHGRDVYVPLAGKSSMNPKIKIEPPHPGVFIYRFHENFNYINVAQHMEHITSYIYAHTRRTHADDGVPLKDRLWNDAPSSSKDTEAMKSRPLLRSVVLDFSAVNIIDITNIQGLIDLRNTLDRYAAPSIVEWHFAGIQNQWTRRALAFAGFGYPGSPEAIGNWKPVYTVATSLAGATQEDRKRRASLVGKMQELDEERRSGGARPLQGEGKKVAKSEVRSEVDEDEKRGEYEPLYGVDRPFFHLDLTDAVDAAVRDAKRRDEIERAARDSESVENER
ncbi:sulfate permease-like protein [Aaosphaeria arxii CBS 175.79]|uniref:Sulfate permease-like protein n=1 Tax=Aaosphaeria arxii CBS 175.79 TaxID=1450172 RepID=A0A6A5XD19_9PLEO|nr:sulfate permease-like protein [Aaosphaeria arxii CBS 175.79]KAF2010809.1 sulfate permease-like protein [Aaosphaeria arxii CBS 175.79]